jgi:glycosyltransferase involved in cell wall biosynthesis
VNVLLVHPNFPGQFRAIAPALAAAGARVVALGQDQPTVHPVEGVTLHRYKRSPFRIDPRYPPLESFANQLRQGRAAAEALADVRASGFVPDVVVGHPGWGDMAFVERIFPATPIVAYLEFFYRADGADVGFDPEFPPAVDGDLLTLRNLVQLLAHQAATRCVTPTRWQRALFPEAIRRSIEVLHEGVDTDAVAPDPAVALTLADGRTLTRETPVLTYCARNLEPYRGFHVFMRSLPAIQRAHPGLFTVVVGGDEVSYGRPPPGGGGWRAAMLRELGGELDASRIVFTGRLPYSSYLKVLQLSTVHVYLTYPFVLSWSALEAMAAGCAIVASDTAPVAEVMVDGCNARLVPFFDRAALAAAVGRLLADPGERARLSAAARADAVARFDFRRVTLPAWQAMIEAVARTPAGAAAAG